MIDKKFTRTALAALATGAAVTLAGGVSGAAPQPLTRAADTAAPVAATTGTGSWGNTQSSNPIAGTLNTLGAGSAMPAAAGTMSSGMAPGGGSSTVGGLLASITCMATGTGSIYYTIPPVPGAATGCVQPPLGP